MQRHVGMTFQMSATGKVQHAFDFFSVVTEKSCVITTPRENASIWLLIHKKKKNHLLVPHGLPL